MPVGELWNSIRGARCNGLTGFFFPLSCFELMAALWYAGWGLHGVFLPVVFFR